MSTFPAPPTANKAWRIRRFEDSEVRRLREDLGLQIPTAKALLANGLRSASEARAFLSPSFENWRQLASFPSLAAGARRLAEFSRGQRRICVHGDFDNDGVLAAVIMREGFAALGLPCLAIIPTRAEGHGLNPSSLRRARDLGAEVIVSVDCGITAVAEAQLAKSLGMELIITDHHLPGSEIPEASVVVCPHLDGAEPFKIYSGAALSLKLVLETASLLPGARLESAAFRGFTLNAIILAALATIGDVVPLIGDNRALVNEALGLLDRASWPAIKSLLHAARVRPGGATAEDLAFQLLPRMNAAQRMGRGDLLWSLFETRDSGEAEKICAALDKLNEERKSHLEETLGRILQNGGGGADGQAAIIVCGDSWREGISGLIASRLSETHRCPAAVILVRDGMGQASLRAPEGYNLKQALDECALHLIGYGGHEGAAGFRIAAAEIPVFRERFLESIRRQGAARAGVDPADRLLILDEIQWPQIEPGLLSELQRLEPFGHGNPRPLFACRGVHLDGPPNFFGANRNHVSLSLLRPGGGRTQRAVGFNMASEVGLLAGSMEVDIAFHFSRDGFSGKPQLQLKAVRPHLPR